MKKSRIILVIAYCLLSSCGGDDQTSVESQSNEEQATSSEVISTSVDSSSESLSISEESSSSLEEVSSSDSKEESSSSASKEESSIESSSSEWISSSEQVQSSESNPSDEVVDLGVKTIAEVRELCKNVTNLNSGEIGIDQTKKVTIRGLAYAKLSLVKTKKSFGLDLSYPDKVMFGDSTGYIACASPNSKDGNTLWGKVADYAGKETSLYEVTGYLSMYRGNPELYVPEKTYTWNQNLDVSFDPQALAKSEITFDQFYTNAKELKYNCAGHGYGDIYTVKNVLCYAKRDNLYIFTDGHKFMKVVKGLCNFVEGKTYDVTGYISTQNWSPAINALKATISETNTPSPTKEDATNTTITDFKKIQSSQDDTDKRMDSFIDSFKDMYKASVYASYYVIDGRNYVTVSDKYYTQKTVLQSRDTAQNSWGMVDIANNNYWNVTETEMFTYCPLKEYINEEVATDIYFMPYQQEYLSKKPVWKIFAFDNLN